MSLRFRMAVSVCKRAATAMKKVTESVISTCRSEQDTEFAASTPGICRILKKVPPYNYQDYVWKKWVLVQHPNIVVDDDLVEVADVKGMIQVWGNLVAGLERKHFGFLKILQCYDGLRNWAEQMGAKDNGEPEVQAEQMKAVDNGKAELVPFKPASPGNSWTMMVISLSVANQFFKNVVYKRLFSSRKPHFPPRPPFRCKKCWLHPEGAEKGLRTNMNSWEEVKCHYETHEEEDPDLAENLRHHKDVFCESCGNGFPTQEDMLDHLATCPHIIWEECKKAWGAWGG